MVVEMLVFGTAFGHILLLASEFTFSRRSIMESSDIPPNSRKYSEHKVDSIGCSIELRVRRSAICEGLVEVAEGKSSLWVPITPV